MSMKRKLKCALWNKIHFNRTIGTGGLDRKYQDALLDHCLVENHGQENTLTIASRCNLTRCRIYFAGNHNQVEIEEGACLNNLEIWIEDDNNHVRIGKNTAITGSTHLACTEGCEIVIGEECLFSSGIIFRTGDSHSILDEAGKRINVAQSILVGNHVWIAQNVTILKGTVLGQNTIVGTGSVVTGKIFDAGVILAGVPATVVKSNVTWNKKRI